MKATKPKKPHCSDLQRVLVKGRQKGLNLTVEVFHACGRRWSCWIVDPKTNRIMWGGSANQVDVAVGFACLEALVELS